MSDVQAAYEDICHALRAGEEAIVEVTEHDDGRLTIDFGVATLPLLTTPHQHARTWSAQFEAAGFRAGIVKMLITAAEFCERQGASVH